MVQTIQIQETDEVMAMFGRPGIYYCGKWENVRIVGISKDKESPLEVRTGLVGLIVPTIFTKESIEEQTGASFPIPKNSRLAYCTDIVEVLKCYGKHREAERLENATGNPFDMYTLEPDVYELLDNFSTDDFRGGRHPFKKDDGFVHPYKKD